MFNHYDPYTEDSKANLLLADTGLPDNLRLGVDGIQGRLSSWCNDDGPERATSMDAGLWRAEAGRNGHR